MRMIRIFQNIPLNLRKYINKLILIRGHLREKYINFLSFKFVNIRTAN